MQMEAPRTGSLLSRGSLIHAKWVQASFLIIHFTQLILSQTQKNIGFSSWACIFNNAQLHGLFRVASLAVLLCSNNNHCAN